MNTFETIGNIAVAVLPLTTLCFGVMVGIDLAEWLASRPKKDKKPDNDEQKDGRK